MKRQLLTKKEIEKWINEHGSPVDLICIDFCGEDYAETMHIYEDKDTHQLYGIYFHNYHLSRAWDYEKECLMKDKYALIPVSKNERVVTQTYYIDEDGGHEIERWQL